VCRAAPWRWRALPVLAQGFGFLGNFGILTGELFLKPFAVFLDERGRAAEMRAALLAA